MLKFRSNAPQKAQPLYNKEILINLLGSLLLLFFLSISILLLLLRSLLNWRRFLSLGFFLDGHKETDDILSLDHVVLIDLKLTEDIINLSLGHLVSPGGESVLEHLGVNLAFIIVSLESLDKVIWIVTLSCHLVCEHLDHVVTGAGSTDLTQESVQLTSDIKTPTLSKAPRRSFLSKTPSLLMSMSLKQSLYIWI